MTTTINQIELALIGTLIATIMGLGAIYVIGVG